MSNPSDRPRDVRVGTGQQPADEGISVLDLLDIVRRRRGWVFIPVLLFTAAFAAVAWWLPPTYTSDVLIMAESLVEDDRTPGADPVDVQEHLASINATIQRRSILEDVAREFDLTKAEDGRITEDDIEEIRSRIDIRVKGEETFEVRYTGSDPQRATDVASRITRLFLDEMAEARQDRAQTVGGILDAEVADLEQKLDEQERRIEEYKRRSVSELPDNMVTALEELRRLRNELSRTGGDITETESRLAAVETEMRGLEERGIVGSNTKVQELEADLRELQGRGYTEKHPEVIRVKRELAAVREAAESGGDAGGLLTDSQIRHMQLEAQRQALESRLTDLRESRSQVGAEVSRVESRIGSMPEHERVLADLERDHEVTQNRYEALLARQQENDLTRRLSPTNRGVSFSIVEEARVPTEPSGPHRMRIVLMGLAMGLALAGAATFLVEQTDASFSDIKEFREFTDLPVLASVPKIQSSNGGGPGGKLVTLHEPAHLATEQYRILAMRVRERLDRDQAKVLMVSSAAGGEGKTTTSINLALALSKQVDGRVLLMDCDLRWPRIHEYLNEARDSGFSDARADFRELLRDPFLNLHELPQEVGGLHVVASSKATDESFDTLVSSSAPTVLSRLRRRFDYIVLDAPPLLPMADSHVLADLADQILLVVRARHTRRELLERASETFEFSRIAGVVLNDVDYQRSRYAYAYDYYADHYVQAARSKRGR